MHSFIFIICIIFSSPSWGRKVIISDIDDTLKISPGLKVSGLLTVLRGESPAYRDMQVLYREWESAGAEFIYLSSSYKYFYDGKGWLEEHGFPSGAVYQRDEDSSLDGQIYKKNTLTEILSPLVREEGHEFIFLGDNLGGDEKVYTEIVRDLKLESKSTVFIRDMLLVTLFSSRPMIDIQSNVKYFISLRDITSSMFLWSLGNEVSLYNFLFMQQSFFSRKAISEPQRENLVQRMKSRCNRDVSCRNKISSDVGILLGNYYSGLN